ncbi:MAG TPA: hypothetical protein DCF68_09105 [Cyanothece sp. UBA12306]|nr:hypothetical protein [Cyanothece sp. UBA12306]
MYMASEEKVKHYLAHWFQLGKQVLLPKSQQNLSPSKIFEGNNYSLEFEDLWQYIISTDADCYLEGTEQTIQQLLSPQWEMIDCARCQMPFPVATAGVASPTCPCFDLNCWPNQELPSPRSAIDSYCHLNRIRQRLEKSDNN